MKPFALSIALALTPLLATAAAAQVSFGGTRTTASVTATAVDGSGPAVQVSGSGSHDAISAADVQGASASADVALPDASAGGSIVTTADFDGGGASGMFMADYGFSAMGSSGPASADVTGTYGFDYTFAVGDMSQLMLSGFFTDPLAQHLVTVQPQGIGDPRVVDLTGGERGQFFALYPGTYTLSFALGMPLMVGVTGPGSAMLTGHDQFRFAIGPAPAPMPEPATWALLIAGFATAGITMRRRAPAPHPARAMLNRGLA